MGTKPRFSGIKLATGYDRANYRFSLLNLQQGRIISAVCQSLTARKIRYNEFCGRHRFLIAIPFCLETLKPVKSAFQGVSQSKKSNRISLGSMWGKGVLTRENPEKKKSLALRPSPSHEDFIHGNFMVLLCALWGL